MRVLMTTTGYAGHFNPLVPFARACVRAGHELRVAAPRSRGAIVERTGLELQACADPAEEDLARLVASAGELSQRDGHAHMMSEGFARVATRAVLPDVLKIIDSWRPDIIVRECQEYAGALAAEREGIPHARVALGLAAQEHETLSVAAGAVDELRAELDLPRDPDGSALRDSPYLTLVPPVLEDEHASEPRATHRFRERRDPPRSLLPLPDSWKRREGPAVYLTLGSVAALLGLFPRIYRAAIESLADLPAKVLVTTGEDADPAELGPMPPNVHLERWVPQEAVIEDVAAVVCHGGYGSVLGALTTGVPVIALPIFSDDQWRNARRVAELEAGIALDGDRGPERRMLDGPRPETFAQLADAVETVIEDPGYRRAARRIAIDMLPPVDAAVDLLLAVARGSHRPDGSSGPPESNRASVAHQHATNNPSHRHAPSR
jgi:UDP:flavonoid glycosyltransferase YjiC (YdhE family)